MQRIRDAIEAGRFAEFKAAFYNNYFADKQDVSKEPVA